MIEIDFGGSPVKTNYRNAGNASIFVSWFGGRGTQKRRSPSPRIMKITRKRRPVSGNRSTIETLPPKIITGT